MRNIKYFPAKQWRLGYDMAHTKTWLSKRVKIDRKWKIKAPFYNRSGSPSDKVLVGSDRSW